jgi:hypothetical protein
LIGPIGLQGPAGPGFVSGSVVTLPAAQTPPPNYKLLGHSTLMFFDPSNHPQPLAVKYYQLP